MPVNHEFTLNNFADSNSIILSLQLRGDGNSAIVKCNFVAILPLMLELHKQAEEMIRNRGERATSARVHVLATLLAEQRAVAHHEIEERVRRKQKLNRVTLYRVLEWLQEKWLAHRVVSADRIWLFRANLDAHPHPHAHFECTRCTTVICLDDMKAEYDRSLPPGYRSHEIELRVKGLCAECT